MLQFMNAFENQFFILKINAKLVSHPNPRFITTRCRIILIKATCLQNNLRVAGGPTNIID